MDWQSAALYQSWIDVGSPGQITRLLSCTEEEYARYENVDMLPTHKTADYSRIDVRDEYSAYNLPGSIFNWTKSSNFTRKKFVVKLDADMILRKAFTIREIPCELGVVAGGYYGYLSGVKNGMAEMFVTKQVEKRLAQVGGWEIFARTDLQKAAPLWFEFTQKVRQDKRVWWPYKGTGDSFITEEHPRPWISEMYGYVFGTAQAGLNHNENNNVQIYAGAKPWNDKVADAFVIHYGLYMKGPDLYEWDKHFEYKLSEREKDKLKCGKENKRKLFPVVGLLSNEYKSSQDKYEKRRIEIMSECVTKINRGILLARKRKCSNNSVSNSISNSNNSEAARKMVKGIGSKKVDVHNEDDGYKHARVSIGGGSQIEADEATKQLWQYAGIAWALTLFMMLWLCWPSLKKKKQRTKLLAVPNRSR